MALPSHAVLTRLCRNALERGLQEGAALPPGVTLDEAVQEVCEVVMRNLTPSSGGCRFERWQAFQRGTVTREDYVAEVSFHWLNEAPLVHRLAANETGAWEMLWQQLLGAARRQVQSSAIELADDAEGIVQQTLEQIYQAVFPFDVPFLPWALRILHNVIRRRQSDARRRGGAHLSLDAVVETESGEPLPVAGEAIEDKRAARAYAQIIDRAVLTRVLARLGKRQRECIVLLYFEQVDAETAAGKLGVKTRTLYVIHNRALARLAQLLKLDAS